MNATHHNQCKKAESDEEKEIVRLGLLLSSTKAQLQSAAFSLDRMRGDLIKKTGETSDLRARPCLHCGISEDEHRKYSQDVYRMAGMSTYRRTLILKKNKKIKKFEKLLAICKEIVAELAECQFFDRAWVDRMAEVIEDIEKPEEEDDA